MREICTFTCGHSSEAKVGVFGRGKARQERLQRYANRKCLHCALQAMVALTKTLTNIKGEKWSTERQNERISRESIRLRTAYNLTVNGDE